MATLAQPHSYSLPILVIGLTHEAPAEALQQLICLVTSVCFLSLRLYHSRTHTYCTHGNGASVQLPAEYKRGSSMQIKGQSPLRLLSDSPGRMGSAWVTMSRSRVSREQTYRRLLLISHCAQLFCAKCVGLRSPGYLLIAIVLTERAG